MLVDDLQRSVQEFLIETVSFLAESMNDNMTAVPEIPFLSSVILKTVW